MSGVRLILALHNHQPVGNFDGVFEASYRDSYLPFLEVMEDYPEIPFVLHTSGPLLEWLVERKPEYVGRRPGDGRGRAGRDPRRRLLRADPDDDPPSRPGRPGPRLFGVPRGDCSGRGPRGVGARAGLGAAPRRRPRRGGGRVHRPRRLPLPPRRADRPGAARLLPDRGRRPAPEGLPRAPSGSATSSRSASRTRATSTSARSPRRRPGSTVVFADDGEKFGAWPESHRHVYRQRLAPALLRHALRQPRVAPRHHLRPRRRLDAAAGQGLSARLVVPRDDRVGPARRRSSSPSRRRSGRLDAASRRRRAPAVRPGRRRLAELQGEVRRDRRDVLADARRSPTASPRWPPRTRPTPTSSRPPGGSSTAASATAPTGTAPSAASTCRTCGARSIAT